MRIDYKSADIVPSILRHYDIRGIYPTEINANIYHLFGKCFGTHIIRQGGHRVCVGYDGRLSSVELEQALVDGLVATGVTVYRLGCGPSPLVYYADRVLDTDGALMITGSHNPPQYNGLKMIVGHQPFYGPMIQDFGVQSCQGHFVKGFGKVELCHLKDDYVRMLVQDFESHYQTNPGLRVAWDPGNGAGGQIVEMLTRLLPGQHFVINAAIDGTFPAHHPDPTEAKNLQQLQALVLEHQCDVGFAFDGDADRLGIIDNCGHIMPSNQFLSLFAKEVLTKHPGATILADVKTSQHFFDLIQSWGGDSIMVATGHSNIKQKIIETGALLAGEMSGHVFFADRYYGYDDGLYAAVRLLGVITTLSSKLSVWRQTIAHPWVQKNFKIICQSNLKIQIIDQIKQLLQQQNMIYLDIDGIRVTSPDGWWLIRASNTEDHLVCIIEAVTLFQLNRLQDQVLSYLNACGLSSKDLTWTI